MINILIARHTSGRNGARFPNPAAYKTTDIRRVTLIGGTLVVQSAFVGERKRTVLSRYTCNVLSLPVKPSPN